jgi:hypothetical protein
LKNNKNQFRHDRGAWELQDYRSILVRQWDVILTLERRDTPFIRIIEKDIEIAWRVTEYSQQQRNLPTMMNTMTGRVLHQFSQWH